MSTWMPLGTRIICCIFVRYCELMNYTGVTKIGLFPVLPKLSAGPDTINGYRKSVIAKFGVQNIHEAFTMAMIHKLL